MINIKSLLKPYYKNSWALLIGIDEYESASPLSYAVSDAREMKNVLVDHLEFPDDHITLLVNNQASRVGILRSFMKYSGNDVEIDDRILVFYAGHGHTVSGYRGDVGYLVPSDADINDYSTLIRWDDFTKNSELIKAKHIFFIMDACYGGLALTRSSTAGSTRFLKDMMVRFSRQVLTAGKADEVVADSGGPLPNHSVFTGHLIEGLTGAAKNEKGILTANGLMNYVYNKVSHDQNSKQTPHYGYFEGDGDFILAPIKVPTNVATEKDEDELIMVPYFESESNEETLHVKINRAKRLLSDEKSTIELHDLMIDETKRFLVSTEDNFYNLESPFLEQDMFDRIEKYEASVIDLSSLCACISYWGQDAQIQLLQKVFSRMADRLEMTTGKRTWLLLRNYPLIINFYFVGIAAVYASKYEILNEIFNLPFLSPNNVPKKKPLVEYVSHQLFDLSQNVFKKIPAHANHFVPISEYLFKLIQPQLDDILFIGKDYEKVFDEFEILFALCVADAHKSPFSNFWAPPGRYSWKYSQREENSPLIQMIDEANNRQHAWKPLKAGMFNTELVKFNELANELKSFIPKMGFY